MKKENTTHYFVRKNIFFLQIIYFTINSFTYSTIRNTINWYMNS